MATSPVSIIFRDLDPSPECIETYKNDLVVQHIIYVLTTSRPPFSHIDPADAKKLAVKIALDLDITSPDRSEMEYRQECRSHS